MSDARGAAALDLCYVAAGRLDGFWETGLAPWDLAAGSLIIREAGGIVSGLDGSENFLDAGHILTGTPQDLRGPRQALRLGNQSRPGQVKKKRRARSLAHCSHRVFGHDVQRAAVGEFLSVMAPGVDQRHPCRWPFGRADARPNSLPANLSVRFTSLEEHPERPTESGDSIKSHTT